MKYFDIKGAQRIFIFITPHYCVNEIMFLPFSKTIYFCWPFLIVLVLAWHVLFINFSFDCALPQTAALYEASLQHLNGHSLWNACCQQVCFKSTRGGGTGCILLRTCCSFTLSSTLLQMTVFGCCTNISDYT